MKTDKGKAIVEKKEWDKMINMAAGNKMKDSTKLLEKSIKQKEKKKIKSKKKWEERISADENEKKNKQVKRKERIEYRKNKKKDK